MPKIYKGHWKDKVAILKSEALALYFAYRDPRVPWYAKAFIVAVVGYALSPIDLIPDFIPVLGYLDDLVLISAGVALAKKMIPPPVMEEARKKAEKAIKSPKNWLVAAFIVAVWILFLVWMFHAIFR